MGRPRKKPVEAVAVETSDTAPGAVSLISALRFANGVFRDSNDPSVSEYSKFVLIDGKRITAFDGVRAVGHDIQEDISACAQGAPLVAAMARTGATYSITQTAGGLSVKSGPYKAVVPCLDASAFPTVSPDPWIAPIDDAVRSALATAGRFVTDSADRVVKCAVLLQAGFCVATDGIIMVQVWHGVDLPPGMLIPKASIAALMKINRPVTGFGYSPNSVTFWFSPHAWFKTQLYVETYVDFVRLLDKPVYPVAIPEHFFEGVEALRAFDPSDVEDVTLNKDMLTTDREGLTTTGASYEIVGLLPGPTLNVKRLSLLSGLVTRFDVAPSDAGSPVYFDGPNLRAIMMPVTVSP